ncbi:hypothetical protein NH8B_3634 [Pseudogulbenkiania sp. NH8B]|nr:hypothetical protein NH8B_3634 [Pseudogulbenkiania sp. NH8B]
MEGMKAMLHLHLKEQIEGELDAVVELHQDALLVHLPNGVSAELRFLDEAQYSFNWRWGDAELRIDTAPLHPELATFPNHLHGVDGQVLADPVSMPGQTPWENANRLLKLLQQNPLLDAEPA